MATENLEATEEEISSYKEFVSKLREKTKGITCATCPYAIWFKPATWGDCTKNVNEFTGRFSQTSKKAPACRQHPEVQELISNESR